MSEAVNDPLAVVAWPVRTQRLVLRRETPADFPQTWAYRGLPEVYEWTGSAPATFESYRERYEVPERLRTKVVVLLEDRIIGDLMIRYEDPWAQAEVVEQAKGTQAELGWTFDPAFHGRGYATEAVRAAVDLCFGPLGLRRVVANCFAANEPSWRLMERIGMRREAHNVKDSLHAVHGWMDNLTYALLAEEWPARA